MLVPQVGIGDSRAIGTRRVLARVIGDRHDPQATAGRLEQNGLARAPLVTPRPGDGDSGRPDELDGVEERIRSEVERVVVGERDGIDAQLGQPLGSHGRRAEEEGLAGIGEGLAALRDAALEVEHEGVGGSGRLRHRPVYERCRRVGPEAVADAAPEHRVARERQRDRPHPRGLLGAAAERAGSG